MRTSFFKRKFTILLHIVYLSYSYPYFQPTPENKIVAAQKLKHLQAAGHRKLQFPKSHIFDKKIKKRRKRLDGTCNF